MKDQIIKEVIKQFSEKYPDENFMTFEELKDDEIQYSMLNETIINYYNKMINEKIKLIEIEIKKFKDKQCNVSSESYQYHYFDGIIRGLEESLLFFEKK